MRLAPPEHLSPTARQIIRQRMWQHGGDMSRLVWAVFALDYEAAGAGAGRISDGVDLARPLTNDATELNSLVPAKFFDLQDEMRSRAGAVAVAAISKDNAALSAAYGALSETCVNCHAAYRAGPPSGAATR